MSASYNSTDFEIRLTQINGRYNLEYSQRITAIRASLTGKLPEEVIDQDLEAHKRAYYLDMLLEALNWRLTTNLVPEGPVKSEDNSEIKYLDYFGFENNPSDAALIFEAKRTKEKLPKTVVDSDINSNITDVISLGLEGHSLTGKWNEWLKTLGDYYTSVKKYSDKSPKRVVISNGEWLVVFSDPENSFCSQQARDRTKIDVFSDVAEMIKNSNRIYELLERSNVISGPLAIEIGDLGRSITKDNVINRLNGLCISKTETAVGTAHWTVSLYVTPIVFLQLDAGLWVWIEDSSSSLPIPVQYASIPDHLGQINEAFARFNALVVGKISSTVTCKTLKEHYESQEFLEMPGVIRLASEQLRTLVVLGEHTHFINEKPSLDGCSFHSWISAKEGKVAISQMIERRDMSSFFIDNELHHCAHKDAFDLKKTKIIDFNASTNRSGKSEEAFCEMWRLDRTLCCRTCVFAPVCESENKFHLPCAA